MMALPEEIRAGLQLWTEDKQSKVTEPLAAALEIQPEPLVWQNIHFAYCLRHSYSGGALVRPRLLLEWRHWELGHCYGGSDVAQGRALQAGKASVSRDRGSHLSGPGERKGKG